MIVSLLIFAWYLVLASAVMMFVTEGQWSSILVFLTGYLTAGIGMMLAVIWSAVTLGKRADNGRWEQERRTPR
jgi:uncharacterized membrane protein